MPASMLSIGVLLACLLSVVGSWGVLADRKVIKELVALRDKQADKVIKLNEDQFKQYVMGSSRPYTIALFFQANQLVSENPSLRLVDLRKEFGYAARSFAEGPNANEIFCMEVLLEDSHLPFQMFQINTLPMVFRLGPSLDIRQPPVDVPRKDRMTSESIPEAYPWTAETMVKYMGGTEHKAGPINRPSLLKSPFFPPVLVATLVGLAYVAYKVYQTDFVRMPWLWMTGTLVIFWWSVSGGMYAYMRGMPLFIRNKEGKLQFFLQGRQGSLAGEGLIMGTTYIAFSASLALIAFALPRVSNAPVRGGLCYLFTILAGYSVYQTFTLWMSKTGYGVVQYLF